MKIVLFDGALANQMIQYIFARCLEEELKDTDEEVYLDDLWFYTQHINKLKQIEQIEHHQYQLNKFPNLKKGTQTGVKVLFSKIMPRHSLTTSL